MLFPLRMISIIFKNFFTSYGCFLVRRLSELLTQPFWKCQPPCLWFSTKEQLLYVLLENLKEFWYLVCVGRKEERLVWWEGGKKGSYSCCHTELLVRVTSCITLCIQQTWMGRTHMWGSVLVPGILSAEVREPPEKWKRWTKVKENLGNQEGPPG